MDLDRVRAVLELVRLRGRLPRQLARLADRDEALAQVVRQRGAEDEAARLDADDRIASHTIVLLGEEIDALTGRAERRLIADLGEVALEPLLRHIGLSPDLAPDLVGRHPDWTRALLTLHRAWRDQAAIANALSDRLNQDPAFGNAMHQMLSHVTAILSSSEILDDVPDLDDVQRQRFRQIISMESHRLSETAPLLAGLFDQSGKVFRASTPADEVDDFMLQHNAWFPELEQAGDDIRRDVARHGGTDEASLTEYLRSKHGTTVARPGSDGPIAASTSRPRSISSGAPKLFM